MVQLALALVAGVLPLRAAASASGRSRAFWLLIGASNLIWALAQAQWTLNVEALNHTRVLAVTDVLFVLCTAPLLVALVIRPDRGSRPSASLWFDVSLFAVLALHGYVYFSAGYLGTAPGAGLSEYQRWVGDIGNLDSAVVMLGALYLLRGDSGDWRRTYAQLGAALLLLNGGSVISSHAVLSGSYVPGLLDLPWSMPFLWMGLAAAEWRPGVGVRERSPAWADTRRGTWLAVSALALVPASHLGLHLSHPGWPSRVASLRDAVTLTTSVAIGVLFLLRQLWVLRRVERAEVERRERMRLLFQANPLPMWVIDAETRRFVDVNEAALSLYGWERETFLASRLEDVAPDSEGLPRPGPAQHRTRDGRVLELTLSTHALEHYGQPGLLSVVEDVSERRAAERERERLRALADQAALEWERTFDAIDACVLVLDARRHVTRLNRAARELAGAAEEPVGRPLARLGSGEPWARAAEMTESVHAGAPLPAATCRDAATGRSFDVWVSPLWTAAGERQIVVARDITGLVELQQSLRHQELTAAMGALIAGVAHEVRNPLFGISATIDAFEATHGKSEELTDFARRLRRELDRLSHLMQELLEYGRPRDTELVPRALAEVVRDAATQCATLAGASRVRIETRLPGDLGVVAMNHQRLSRVFRNVIENAVQHSRRLVLVEGSQAEGFAECSVADDGPGFASEDLPRVFEPFYTRRRGGTGIGLSIVQRIVEEHGGKVGAANRPGGGGVVTVRLPLVGVSSPASVGSAVRG